MMQLSKFLTNQLYQLSKDRADVAGTLRRDEASSTYTWDVPFEGHSIHLEFASPDRHSAELCKLQMVSVQPLEEDAPVPPLRDFAEALGQRLGYLEESLATWELEEKEQTIQLRSLPPHHEDGEVHYWEALVQRAPSDAGLEITTRISRYRWQPGMPERTVMRYPATYAFVGRLAESLLPPANEK
jgi:hypothetical protein